MTKRSIYWTFRGHRDVSLHERRVVDRIVRCERFPRSRKYVRRIERREIKRWKTRRQIASNSVPESSLAVCIIQRESGGNPQAINGQYEGIAQWSPTSWIGGGGGKFSSTPLGATYSEQVQILNSMLPAQIGQWQPSDGC